MSVVRDEWFFPKRTLLFRRWSKTALSLRGLLISSACPAVRSPHVVLPMVRCVPASASIIRCWVLPQWTRSVYSTACSVEMVPAKPSICFLIMLAVMTPGYCSPWWCLLKSLSTWSDRLDLCGNWIIFLSASNLYKRNSGHSSCPLWCEMNAFFSGLARPCPYLCLICLLGTSYFYKCYFKSFSVTVIVCVCVPMCKWTWHSIPEVTRQHCGVTSLLPHLIGN